MNPKLDVLKQPKLIEQCKKLHKQPMNSSRKGLQEITYLDKRKCDGDANGASPQTANPMSYNNYYCFRLQKQKQGWVQEKKNTPYKIS